MDKLIIQGNLLEQIVESTLVFIHSILPNFDWDKLRKLNCYLHNTKSAYEGYCQKPDHPKHRHKGGGYIKVAINKNLINQLPWHDNHGIATEKCEHSKFRWVYKNKVYKTIDEVLIYLLFHEVFHFLRYTKQLPVSIYGGNYETCAERFGLFALHMYHNNIFDFDKWANKYKQYYKNYKI